MPHPSSVLQPRDPTTPTPAAPVGTSVAVGLGNNHQTVTVQVGEEVLVTVPSPAERELSRESVRCSNPAVLQQQLSSGSRGVPSGVLRVPFVARSDGSATLSATGPVAFTIEVDVGA